MAVIQLDIYDKEDLNGTPLGSLTDEDLKHFSMRVGRVKYNNGWGKVEMSRHHADAGLLATGNLARVLIPSIHATNYQFAFFLEEDETILLAGQPDRANEDITISGPGAFDILRRAMLDATQAGSGSFAPSEGMWRDTDSKYTDLLDQMFDEDAANTTPALSDVTWDFTPTLDSDGNASPNMDDEFALDIGTDYATAFRRLALTDDDFELFLNVGSVSTPQLLLQAFATYGTDRTSATFAAGKVRFVAPGNLLTELTRKGRGTKRGSHALVGGKDGVYRLVVRGDWVPPEPVRRIFVSAPETNSPVVMDRIGQRALNEHIHAQDMIDLEFTPGDDDTTGLYLPGKHFKPGDTATLDSGSGFRDYVDRAIKIQAWRLQLHEAADDASTTLAIKSLKVAVEMGAIGSQGTPGTENCCEAPGSQTTPPILCPPPELSELVAFGSMGTEPTTAIDGSGDNLSLPAGWEEDDIFILWHVSDNDSITPTGWTLIAKAVVSGTDQFRLAMYWKRATASESVPSVAATAGGNAMAIIAAFRGCPTTGSPINIFASGTDAADDTAISIPGATTTVPTCLVLASHGGRGQRTTSGWANADLVDFAEIQDVSSPEGLEQHLGVAAGMKTAAGAYAATTATLSSAQRDNMISVALLPAEVGVAPEPISGDPQGTPGTENCAAHGDHTHPHGYVQGTGPYHDAADIAIADAATDFTATDVEGALAELQSDAEAHLADTTDAHDASAISFVPNGSISASNVQDAIVEVRDEASGSGISTTIVDAKGDLIVATAADTVARRAVGSNGQVLTADSAETDGVKWATPISGGLTVTRKASDEAFSSTSFADSTDLTFAVAASTNYHFRFVVFYTTNATSVGIRLAVNGPASPTGFTAGVIQATGANANDVTIGTNWVTAYDVPLLSSTTGPGSTNQAVAIIEGILRNGANAGTLALRHASETATATTIFTDSFGTLTTF